MKKGEKTKEKIKQVSLGLIHKNGYKNTSINNVLDSSGVKKGTFYFHYESKEKLVVEVLNEGLLQYDDKIKSKIEHEAASDQLIDMIEAIAEYHLRDETLNGCIFGNMGREIGQDGSKVSMLVENVFEKWEARFERLLIKAVDNKELELKESAMVLARVILALIQGGLVLSKISGNIDSFKDCKGFIISLIEERKI